MLLTCCRSEIIARYTTQMEDTRRNGVLMNQPSFDSSLDQMRSPSAGKASVLPMPVQRTRSPTPSRSRLEQLQERPSRQQLDAQAAQSPRMQQGSPRAPFLSAGQLQVRVVEEDSKAPEPDEHRASEPVGSRLFTPSPRSLTPEMRPHTPSRSPKPLQGTGVISEEDVEHL